MAPGRRVRVVSLALMWACAGGARPQYSSGTPSAWLETELEEVSSSGEACVPLKNEGSSSTVNVFIGSPPQGPFRLIADTGSNALIVQSCFCGSSGNCNTDADTHCFTGVNKSSSFEVFGQEGWVNYTENPYTEQIMFGSGTIRGIIVKDEVCVGNLCITMDDAFLSMVSAQLSIPGPTIEGILGLGLPESTDSTPIAAEEVAAEQNSEEAAEQNLPDGYPMTTSFLEQANISRFSMCFNEDADGVLRLGTPARTHALGSFGVMHWGVGVEGLSVVGSAGAVTPMTVELCTPASMTGDQETPCGAIPDSGTTMITGDERHIVIILATLCEAWERCMNSVDPVTVANAQGSEADDEAMAELVVAKADAFENVVKDCASWLNDGAGLAELPTLRFTLSGKGEGHPTQAIDLPGVAYIFETVQEEMQVETLNTPIGEIPIGEPTGTGNYMMVCRAAFDPMPYDTVANGPIFILGTPLFYEYVVDYDLGTETPSMAFTSVGETPCGSCDAQLIEMGSDRQRQRQQLRRVVGPLRKPNIDVSKPF